MFSELNLSIRVYLRLLIVAVIRRLQTLHLHTLAVRVEAPEPVVGLQVALTLMLTGTSASNTSNNKHV